MPNPVNWFEIPVHNLDRAQAFYAAVFGFAFQDAELGPSRMAFFPSEMTSYGAGGSLVQQVSGVPSHAGTTVYFPVGDIDAHLTKASDAGGRTIVPKTDIGQFGWFAQFEDSEGNRVGLHTAPAVG